MDSLEKLAESAQNELENAYVYFAKVGESMGRLENIVKNIRKKAEKDNEVVEGGIPPKQTPPKCTADVGGPKGVVQSVSVGVEGGCKPKGPGGLKCPVGEPGKAGPATWHSNLKPYGIAKTIVGKSSYVIPPKCIKFRFFEDGDGDFFIEFRVAAEHHHSSTTFVAVEEFSIPLLDCLDEQVEVFDRNIGNLVTVKFPQKGYADDADEWSNL